MINKLHRPRFALTFVALLLAPLHGMAAETQNLLDIYRQAQANDPTLSSAKNSRLAADEKLVQGKALLLPSVDASANALHSNSESKFSRTNTVFGAGNTASFETYGYRLDLTHPLYNKGNRVQYEESKTQVAQAEEQLNTARQDLMLRVAQAYFDVLLAQDQIDLIAAQKAAITRQLEQAKANFEVGTATIVDVNEAQARFDLIVAQEIAAVNDLEVKKRSIQAITTQLPARLATAKSNLQATVPEPAEMEKWVEIAEQNNLALKIQQQALVLATQEVERTHAGHLPTVDVTGQYADTRSNGGTNGFGLDLKILTVGLQLNLPVYKGGSITSREREAAANKLKAQDDVEAARRQADLQARQSYLNVSSTIAQVKALEQALASSQSQLDSTNLGYEVGVRTSVDVLNAQQQLYSAKRDLLQARYNYLLSVLRLKSAAGVLTDNDMSAINQLLEGA